MGSESDSDYKIGKVKFGRIVSEDSNQRKKLLKKLRNEDGSGY